MTGREATPLPWDQGGYRCAEHRTNEHRVGDADCYDEPGRKATVTEGADVSGRRHDREFIADVLHDCLSSFQGLDHGEGVCCFDRDAAVEYLLSPASGLRIKVDE